MVAPRYLTEEVGLITVPLQVISRDEFDLSLCLDPNKIDSVLHKCSDNVLSTSH